MTQAVYTRVAGEDLKEILAYISQDKPGAAKAWIKKIKDKCELIASSPEIGELALDLGRAVRKSYVGRYIIFYRPVTDGIEVLRVLAGEQDISTL
ncbi:MAG: type II toxin-antitoxin system RelE/ParE family toxin [Pirellulales bacterium]|jgi:toxin ParE1/3/4